MAGEGITMNTKENEIYNIFKEQAQERFETSPKLASMTDLVSIILGKTRTRPTMAIAEEVTSTYMVNVSTRNQLEDINFRDLISIPGITKNKAMQICAAIELGRRLSNTFNKRRAANFNTPDKVANFFMEKLRHENQEHLLAVYISTQNTMLGYKEITIGDVNTAHVDIKEIIKWACRYKASGIILVHNHPSGNPTPSNEDISITETLAQAAKLIDCTLLDHIIIGDGIYTSLKERGHIE